jgi:hypothetical protein
MKTPKRTSRRLASCRRTPPLRPRYSLDELVRRIAPKNRHDESDWGGPLGDETW